VPNGRQAVDKFDIRMDVYFSAADTLTGTYSFNRFAQLLAGAFPVSSAVTQSVRDRQPPLEETPCSISGRDSLARTPHQLREDARIRCSRARNELHRATLGIGGFADQAAPSPASREKHQRLSGCKERLLADLSRQHTRDQRQCDVDPGRAYLQGRRVFRYYDKPQ
jgi:hypothetical protein